MCTPQLRAAMIDTYAKRIVTGKTAHELYLDAGLNLIGFGLARDQRDYERMAIEAYWFYASRARARELRKEGLVR